MQKIVIKMLIGTGLLFTGAAPHADAQAGAEQPHGQVQVALIYNQTEANVVDGKSFWMQGGSAQLDGHLWRGLSAVADVAGMHAAAINNFGIGLDIVSATFGVRYTGHPVRRRIGTFAETLVGEAYGANSLFPGPNGVVSSSHSLALELGGGIDLPLSRRVQLRAIQIDWLRTQLPNATTNVQNNLLLGFGVVYRVR